MTRARFVRLLCAAAAVSQASAQRKKEKVQSYGLIMGTVFREPGFALPGAALILEPEPEPGASVRVKKMKAVSDARGEFVFRVPAAAMRYRLVVSAPGYESQSRTVVQSGEESQDVFFTLRPTKEDKK